MAANKGNGVRSTVHHFGIIVADLDASIAFYKAAFGLEVVMRDTFAGEDLSRVIEVPDAVLEFAFVAGENVIIEMIEHKGSKGRPYTLRNNDVGAPHVCFVVDDIDEVYQRLLGLGAKFSAPPQIAPDIAPYNGLKYTYCRDINGVSIELLEPKDGPISLPQLLSVRGLAAKN
jgi:catechol 2,3-dioxygenase-like lactoylglutathione lyase family enzyme